MHGREQQRRVDALPEAPPSLDAERAIALDRLAARALSDQQRLVSAGIERALRHVPRVLRGPVRRALDG